ncbi:DUF4384 domain-containing protein [Bacteroidota bacterium]
MKKYCFTVLMAFISCQVLFSQVTPNWVNSAERNKNYPESFYLSGFSSKNTSKQENINAVLKQLSENAKLNLIESVSVKINGISELYTQEENYEVQQSYKQMIASSSSLDIVGLKIETYYNPKKRIAYAFASANKSDVSNYYKNLIVKKINQIEGNIESSKAAYGKKDNQYALKKYRENFPIFRELEEAQSIYLALKSNSMYNEDIQISKITQLKKQVDDGIRELEKSSVLTLDDVCNVLAYAIKDQAGDITEKILLSNFTYQDTRMASELSLRFSQTFQNKLIQDIGFNVSTNITYTEEKTLLVLMGTYWEEADGIKVIATLKNIQTGNILASSQATVPKSWLNQSNISIKPENFEDAYSRMKHFNKDEIYGGDLNLEFWTNKGDENLVYEEGERMKIFVRTNKECYLRVIYHLADGSSVLLVDNYYIGIDKVNIVYELPYEFECSSPFGVEVLQVNGQTQKFTALSIVNNSGYNFIQDGIVEIIQNTRGMKMTDDLMKAERRIVITTLPN